MNINVTKPFLPSLQEYQELISSIWERGWLTNNGPLVNELELKLKNYLNIEHFLYLNNGTIALQIAIKALNIQGEVITTPFSYVATTSSLVWEGCTPVMVDIDSNTLNINADIIREKITPNTKAIMATHVFGNPCELNKIDEISKEMGIPVIYDAAHAFGVEKNGRSIFSYGDISTTSFHATKIFHTIEGGAVITQNADLLKKMSLMRNFGHTSPTSFGEVGINAKNSEFHAAMGLCVLPHIEYIIQRRKIICGYYDENLSNLPVKKQLIDKECKYNYSYYPIIFQDEATLLKSMSELNANGIYPRRYFYPSLSHLPYLKNVENTPVSDNIAPRILCLPLYPSLSKEEVDMICRLIARVIRYG